MLFIRSPWCSRLMRARQELFGESFPLLVTWVWGVHVLTESSWSANATGSARCSEGAPCRPPKSNQTSGQRLDRSLPS